MSLPMATAKASTYLRYRYGFFKIIQLISLAYPEYQLGFYWISRIRCGFKLDSTVAIERRVVSKQCPTTCPCCGEGSQTFTHWILRCKEFQEARDRYMPFLQDLYTWLSSIINQTSPSLSLSVALDSERDYDDNINYLLLNVLLGGQAVYKLLHVSNKDRKLLIDGLFYKTSMGSDPYFVGLAAYLTHTIRRITQSFELLFEWYGQSKRRKDSTIARCVDVETIRLKEGRRKPSSSMMVSSDSTESIDNTTITVEECDEIETYF